MALVNDYARILTKDSSIRRRILQVVEADRKAYKDCNKATLDKYELMKTLGSSFTAKVKLARDKTGKKFALKIFD